MIILGLLVNKKKKKFWDLRWERLIEERQAAERQRIFGDVRMRSVTSLPMGIIFERYKRRCTMEESFKNAEDISLPGRTWDIRTYFPPDPWL